MPDLEFNYKPSQLLEDIRTTAAALDKPFNEATTRKIINAFPEQFKTGGVILRTSNQPGAGLDYRFFMRGKTDVLGIAEREGMLDREDPLTELVLSWYGLYDGTPEASGDFSAGKGLAKIWLFLGAIRPVDEVLAAPGVPEGIRAHGPKWKSLGLTDIQHVAVDYQKRSINFYFAYYGETTRQRATDLAALANGGPPSDEWYEQMNKWLPLDGYPFSVTMKLDGTISRVCFYALRGLPADAHKVDPTITKFWEAAPCHDEDDFKSLGWSFGGKPYLKSERGYCGNIASFGEYWGVFPESLETAAA